MWPTLEQTLGSLEASNVRLWPVLVVAYVLGIGMLTLVYRRTRTSGKIITAALAALWLWMGITFFLLTYARLHTVAYSQGALFVIHGILLLTDVARPRLEYHDRTKAPRGCRPPPPSRPVRLLPPA